jgi:hypothetical protein
VFDENANDIYTAAYTIYRKYRQWVSYAEMLNVCSQHFDVHPELAELPPRKLQRRLRKVAESVARRAKAEQTGYKTEDEYFYSVATIDKLLPYALDTDATPPPTLADEMQINRSHSGKAEGYGGWEAAIADIRKAIAACGQVASPRTLQWWLGGPNPHKEAA